MTLANIGEENIIHNGSAEAREIRKHLEDLGFVAGGPVTVVSALMDGNIIVKVKESRIAISEEMAQKIMI